MSQNPTGGDPVSQATAQILGGPRGAHVAASHPDVRGWFVNPLVLLSLGSGLLMTVAVMLRQFCRLTDWASPGQFTYSCYSDIPTMISRTGFGGGTPPLFGGDAIGSQSVGSNMLMWFVASLRGGNASSLSDYFDIAAVLITILLVVATAAAVRLAGDRPWDAGIIALSPLHVAVSLINLDMAAVTLTLWALLCLKTERFSTAGILLGLAVLIVPQLVVAIIALLLVGARERFHVGMMTTVAVSAGLALLCNVYYFIVNREAFTAWWAEISQATPGYGSVWFIPTVAGTPIPENTATLLTWVGITVALFAVGFWAVGHPTRPDVSSVTLVLLIAVVLVAPKIPVQASLWLLPWVAVVVRRWSIVLPWALVEVFYATMTWQYIYTMTEANKGAPGWVYCVAIVLRVVAWLMLAFTAILGTMEPKTGATDDSGDSPDDDPATDQANTPEANTTARDDGTLPTPAK